MAATFELEIATPERLFLREQVSSAQIPAENGYLGVLPDHAPLFAQLGIGALSWEGGIGGGVTLMVSEGFIEVRDNRVRILADEAIPASEIDVSKAEQDLREVQEQMAHPAPDADIEALLIRYRNATARIETARQGKG